MLKNFKISLNLNYFSIGLFIFYLFYFIYINLKFFHLPIVEDHAFRQTQTAITAFYFIKNGFSLAYETPVLGQNWSIPFEFPIYQILVAWISQFANLDLSKTGRFLNLLFTTLTCIPFYFSLKVLKINTVAIFFSLTLFISSPIYTFWAGTFMIEGAALFFAISFFYYCLVITYANPKNRDYIFLSFFLAAGLLQKVTTVLPVLIIMTILYLFHFYKSQNKSIICFIKVSLAILFPLVICYLWIFYSDLIKLQNALGEGLTSKAMFSFVYGSLADRLSSKLWLDVMYYRNIVQSSFYFIGLLFIFLSLIFLKDSSIKKTILIFVSLFLLPFLIFSNLHIRHNYYQFANTIYLSATVGISVVYLLQSCQKLFGYFYKPLTMCIIFIFIYYNYAFFVSGVLQNKIWAPNSDVKLTLQLTNFVKANTPIDSFAIWFTKMGWSSEFAFFAERKSLTWLNNGPQALDMITHWNKYLSKKPSAIIFCESENQISNNEFYASIKNHFSDYSLKKIGDCSIFYSPLSISN